MKSLSIIFFAWGMFLYLPAQDHNHVELRSGKIAPAGTTELKDTATVDFDPVVTNVQEQPHPASELRHKKEILHRQRLANSGHAVKKNAARGAVVEPPVYLTGFNANVAQGTPNDNHIAISRQGIIVSVVNTNIRVYDTLGNLKSNRSLQNFASPLGMFTQNSDPRVLYDPLEDRFIIVFFSGNTSANNRIVIGFSKTSDPVGQWNLYSLPGNFLNDTTWSDYPIVSINKNDLFMTFNQLKDGQGWQTGFRYSIIWQIDKKKGYAGDTLSFNYWSKPQHNGKPIWSICPVMEGGDFLLNESYFLSVRPDAWSNDTVFLHKISNSVASGNATFSTKILKTSTPYSLPPNAVQPDGQQLATNDARVLHAIIHHNRIYYGQNCKTPSAFTSGIYLGRIDNATGTQPIASGKIIGFDTMDLAYPSLAHVGKNAFDYQCLLTCSFVSLKRFPGTAAFFLDNHGEVSDMLVIRTGDNNLNVLADTVERWGDYTGIQRRYDEEFTAWLSGSYARQNGSNGTWVAKITTSDTSFISSAKSIRENSSEVIAYPNPASERFELEFETQQENFTNIELYAIDGKKITTLLEDRLKPGKNKFSFNISSLPAGVYLVTVKENRQIKVARKLEIR
jgi:hypothetical protein